MFKPTLVFAICICSSITFSQGDKFEQLYDEFATPNVYRNAAGAPGPQYYQQQLII